MNDIVEFSVYNIDMKDQCPDCQAMLYFSPNGRFRICERCGYKEPVERPRPKVKDLLHELSMMSDIKDDSDQARSGTRILLAQGVGAAKAGEIDEAYFALAGVLRRDAPLNEKVEAWMWLSEVFEELADKRVCLEQVLALNPAHGLARRGIAILDGRLQKDEIIDPDHIEPTRQTGPLEADAEQFVCMQCNGRMNYTPDGESLICEFCGFTQTINEVSAPQPEAQFGQGAFEQDFTAALSTAKGHLQPVNMRTFQCNNCAVDFVLTPEMLSVTCPYCGGVYVTETAESNEIMPPHALLPFAVDADKARFALRNWFKQHRIERPRVSPIVGIYLPVWTFDVGGELKWSGFVKRGDDWVPANGNRLVFYDDVLVPGSKKLANGLAKGLNSFDFAALTAYDARYLADWPAERYQLPLADASLQGRRQVLKRLRKRPDSVTGSTDYVKDLRLHSNGLMIESFKLLLLPMWIAHYKLDDKVYDVTVNGQTAVVHGERPHGIVGKLFGWLRGE